MDKTFKNDVNEEALARIDQTKKNEDTFLDLSYLGLTTKNVPKKIAQLTALTTLDLDGNQLTSLPPEITQLTALTTLNLDGNQLTSLPPEITQLTALTTLRLDDNQLTSLPPEITQLTALTTLYLNDNQLTALPKEIVNLNLNISKDQFEDGIFLENNPLENPPMEIVQQGRQAIRNYFSQLEKESGETLHLFEAKLIIIGEGGTGKTTFVRKIQDSMAEMPKDKDTTLGIDVSKWSYEIDSPIRDLGRVQFYVNLWDFGGQKIYRGTHQIFFSTKSFYVLVADSREEKTDFPYWLNTVKQLAGEGSSLFIILNKKHGHTQKFDESGYQKYFGNIMKGVMELDLKHDTTKIHKLQDTIKFFLTQLPGIGDLLPSSWVKIREDLLNEQGTFISFDRFRELCAAQGITEPTMIHTLSGYFNRIGAFTHYIDDKILQERIYLNSNWLVKTVYEILDHERVKSKKGRLTETEVLDIWKNNELHYEVNKLTQLMNKFGLMYSIPHSQDYVVPAHLPTLMPYHQWEYSDMGDILHFIYEFDQYMPQGLMSRLIVALHRYITNHDFVWHKGFNLESNRAHAEIVESYDNANTFHIRLVGSNKIELLAIIRAHFAEILAPFKGLTYTQLVPCVCRECRNSTGPGFHRYDKLLEFREKGRDSQCPKSGELVDVNQLLKLTEVKAQDSFKEELPEMSQPANSSAVKTLEFFLASSSELKQDREQVEIWINRENKKLIHKGLFLNLNIWEDFLDAMSKIRLQDEYNKAAEQSDIFICLFATKVGKYTEEEFEVAYKSFQERGKPKYVYTYFKGVEINTETVNVDNLVTLKRFQKKLDELGHYKTPYKSTEDLLRQLGLQLDKILKDMGLAV